MAKNTFQEAPPTDTSGRSASDGCFCGSAHLYPQAISSAPRSADVLHRYTIRSIVCRLQTARPQWQADSTARFDEMTDWLSAGFHLEWHSIISFEFGWDGIFFQRFFDSNIDEKLLNFEIKQTFCVQHIIINESVGGLKIILNQLLTTKKVILYHLAYPIGLTKTEIWEEKRYKSQELETKEIAR